MDNTGQATTTMFERALGVGLGIFDFACDSAQTPVENPKENNSSTDKPKKPKRPRNRRDN